MNAERVPSLTEDEFAGLEASILREGCRDAIILWGKIIVDGHNRYRICRNHNISFDTEQKKLASRDEVKLWMLQNQLSRRNLNDFQRVELVRKCEDAVKAQARLRQGTRTDLETNIVEKFPPSSKARDELGAMAGVSGKTYDHAVTVLDKASEAVIEATRRKELSINAAYGVTKLPEEQQAEIASRIAKGESAKAVITEVKSKSELESNSDNLEWSGAVEKIESEQKVESNVDLFPVSKRLYNELCMKKKYRRTVS